MSVGLLNSPSESLTTLLAAFGEVSVAVLHTGRESVRLTSVIDKELNRLIQVVH
jgi:hypothetical protein